MKCADVKQAFDFDVEPPRMTGCKQLTGSPIKQSSDKSGAKSLKSLVKSFKSMCNKQQKVVDRKSVV